MDFGVLFCFGSLWCRGVLLKDGSLHCFGVLV